MTGFLKTSALLSVAAVVASAPLDAKADKATGSVRFGYVGDSSSCPEPPWTPGEEAARTRSQYIEFVQPFAVTPTIFLSVTLLDAYTGNGVRYYLDPEYVSPYGFLVKFGTWCNTYIYSVRISWLALE